MMNFEEMDPLTILSMFVGILVIMVTSILYFARKQSEEPAQESEGSAEMEEAAHNDKPDAARKANKQRKNDQWKPKVKDASYDHPWSVTTLKGHTAAITGMDFAQDGKKFVTVSADRTAFLWDVRVSGLLFKQGNAR
ncbi:unnamed protein product [Heligmosomoides polygyrus]|uniref:WD_REPEATS_REGION domain-containing protein n=1 Tax=Heligmosomoides polygyrus TaxID=6339 RepID=A0A183GXB2_HELPZ|nr:unnamed protein product [Heligmosomoides polygyrus]